MWFGLATHGQYELPIPLGLGYPVLLYLFAQAKYTTKPPVPRIHLVLLSAPLFAHLMLFVIAALQPATSGWARGYAMVYYVSCMLSLLVYATLAARLSHRFKGPTSLTDILIRQLTMLCFGLVVLIYLVLYETSVSKSDLGFEIRPAVHLFLIIGFALIARYLIAERIPIFSFFRKNVAEDSSKDDDTEDRLSTARMTFEPELVRAVERELNHAKLFLNPSVSLDMLAEQTSIPRHQLTQIFSIYYKKSFYQIIAGMRTAYAVREIVKMEKTVTLESLAYACGFNSKTSFNRYFKAYTGMTPSDYRSAYLAVAEHV